MTDLQLVCKLKFVPNGHIKKKISALCASFNSDGPLKYEVSHLKNLIFSIFKLRIRNLFLLYNQEFWSKRAQGSSSGIKPYTYVLKRYYKENPQKIGHISDFGGEAVFAPAPSRRAHETRG